MCNALQHLPHCIKYMQGLRDRDVFRFCAIPQIMAIGTLALCYNNGAIFEGAWAAATVVASQQNAPCTVLARPACWHSFGADAAGAFADMAGHNALYCRSWHQAQHVPCCCTANVHTYCMHSAPHSIPSVPPLRAPHGFLSSLQAW